jgi:hypothetical protein
MRRIVPSQICAFIERMFPEHLAHDPNARLDSGNAAALLALVEMLDAIPDELLPDDIGDLERILAAKHAVSASVQKWGLGGGHYLRNIIGYNDAPLPMIHAALVKCPDQRPSKGSTRLDFLRDPALAESIENDEVAAGRALANGDWKGATVLAAAAIEALLLACLQQARVFARLTTMPGAPKTPGDMEGERWGLHQLTLAASAAGVLHANTVKQVELAKDFRNLIHTGRAHRIGQRCDRGTAYGALAALDLTVEDVRKHFP